MIMEKDGALMSSNTMPTQLLNHSLLQGVKTAAEGSESGVNTAWWVANEIAKQSGGHENKAPLDHITA